MRPVLSVFSDLRGNSLINTERSGSKNVTVKDIAGAVPILVSQEMMRPGSGKPRG